MKRSDAPKRTRTREKTEMKTLSEAVREIIEHPDPRLRLRLLTAWGFTPKEARRVQREERR